MGWLRHPFRVGFRLAGFFAVTVGALTEHFVFVRPREKGFDYQRRARWSQRWGRRYLRVLQVEVTVVGEPPAAGLLVSNHLGYVDIPVLAATSPMGFVSKAEGRMVDLRTVQPGAFATALAQQWEKDAALLEVVLSETRRIVRMERGVLINATHDTVVRLLPPLNVTAEQVDEGCAVLADVLREMANEA